MAAKEAEKELRTLQRAPTGTETFFQVLAEALEDSASDVSYEQPANLLLAEVLTKVRQVPPGAEVLQAVVDVAHSPTPKEGRGEWWRSAVKRLRRS